MERQLEERLGSQIAGRVRWALANLYGVGPAQPEAAIEMMADDWRNPDRLPRLLRLWGRQIVRPHPIDLRVAPDGLIIVVLEDVRGRRWNLRCRVELVRPHGIRHISVERELPPNLTIRDAMEADAPALASIERQTPIVGDDGASVTVDRGEHYWDYVRLMKTCRVLVAEADGEPIGMDAGAVHDARVGGALCRVGYHHHTRILPAYQRGGLAQTLAARWVEWAAPALDWGYAYIDPHTQSTPQAVGDPSWSVNPYRALLPCSALAGPPAGRHARPEDTPRIVALLNACHGNEEMYVPYDAKRLPERLGRLPDGYGWSSLWLGDGAVVGVWPVGERRVREEGGQRTESCRALVLDYGFASDAHLGEFERLLRAWCGHLAGCGITHLSIFTCNGSPGSELIDRLAETVEPYEFQTVAAEPPGAASRGLYVDQIYF